jgi:hypothetical protein
MSFDLNGTQLSYDGSALNTIYGGNQIQKITNTGLLQKYATHPMFMATNPSAAWVYPGAGTWSPITMNVASPNYQTCFNTSTYLFTAPVTGLYLFTGQTYLLSGATTSDYVHPMFWVNGSMVTRRPITSGVYRMRVQSVTAGYSADGDINELISLVAGDYVQYYHFFSTATVGWYPPYSQWTGTLVA